MSLRWVDLDNPKSEYEGFTFRKNVPTLVQLFFIFLAFMLAGAVLALWVEDKIVLIALLFVLLGCVSYFVSKLVHRQRELQKKLELQNALFASAMAGSSRFCLIATQDGTIVYANPDFNALFPLTKDNARLDTWLAEAKAPPEQRNTLFDLIANRLIAKLALTTGTPPGAKAWLISVEPVHRPKGFYLLRATDHVA